MVVPSSPGTVGLCCAPAAPDHSWGMYGLCSHLDFWSLPSSMGQRATWQGKDANFDLGAGVVCSEEPELLSKSFWRANRVMGVLGAMR